ncbi:MAG: EFR1 family ferrodoxin [Oscillospiraceae bacterium]|nr:EFR1 family ferrodoxin [Oscillospiraceae bacterium]
MRVLLIYYTGTYHTRYLTEQVKARFVAKGCLVDTLEITCDAAPVKTDGYDLIGFSYPIYGFNSPRPFNRYVKTLTFHKGQRYFIYKNSGEVLAINNASSRWLIRYLHRFAMELQGEYHFVMPYNIHFPYARDFVRQILHYDQKLLDILFYDLAHGTGKAIPSRWYYDLAAFFVSIQKIGGDLNSFFYRVDETKCTHCGKCVRDCPERNIYEKNDRLRFHHHCDMCMRCSFHCPQNAIHIGFLEPWKVNGAYPFRELEADQSPLTPYITKDSKGFYKCFIAYFEQIDREHKRLFRE